VTCEKIVPVADSQSAMSACILVPNQNGPSFPRRIWNVPKVQGNTASQNLNTNEIQSITTSVFNEIQVIRTSATPHAEIQVITVSPPSGDMPIDSAYSFALSLDTIETGGSLQFYGQISANADANGSRSSVGEILESMTNVHAAHRGSHFLYQWAMFLK
jgi:hypothetical protein